MKIFAKHRAVFSISLLWLGQGLAAGAAFVTQLVLARTLSVTEYGEFAVAVTAVMLFAPIAGFGVGAYWLRCFGKEGWAAFRWVRASFRCVALTTVAALLSLLLWAWLGGQDRAIRPLLLWLAGMLVAQPLLDLAFATLQLQERYEHLAIWQVMSHAGRLLVALAALWLNLNVIAVAQGYLLVALLTVTCCMAVLVPMARGKAGLYGHGDRPTIAVGPGLDAPGVLDVLRGAWPFALGGVFYLIYFQSDILLISWIKGLEAAAVYNVSFVTLAAIYLLPSVIYQKFLLPHFHRWAEHDRDRFLSVYRFGNGSMLVLGMAIGVLLALVSTWLVPILFGTCYAEAGRLLILLSVCVPVRFLATSVGATLVTGEHMRRKVRYQGAVALLNVVLNLILIPSQGIYGAALATVISEMVLLAFYLVAVSRHVFGRDAWRGWNIDHRTNSVHTSPFKVVLL